MKAKLVNFLKRAPDEFKDVIGGEDIQVVENLLNDDHLEDRLGYIKGKLEELRLKICDPNSPAFGKFIRRMYKEDAARTIKWFIIPKFTPECPIKAEEFENTYGDSWEEDCLCGDDEEFKLKCKIQVEDEEINY